MESQPEGYLLRRMRTYRHNANLLEHLQLLVIPYVQNLA